MNSEAHNTFFGREAGQLHFNENIHDKSASRILAYLVFNLAVDFTNISELSIQEEIDKLMQYKLNNTQYRATTEPSAFGQRRLDYLIMHSPTGEHLVYYEFKTAIKPHENTITERMVFPDLIKLAIKKHDHEDCKAYLLLAGKKNVFREAIESGSVRLPNKYNDPNSREKVVLSFDDLASILTHTDFENHLAQLKNRGIKKISISPSRWKDFEDMTVLTFKLNKNVYR